MDNTEGTGGKLFAGRYRKVKRLGSGMMASVYLANDTAAQDALVALKILHVFRLEDDEFVVRFRREIKALKAISHPNVVRISDAGFDGEQLYFSMEYVEGETLRARLSRGRPSFEEVRSILNGIAVGLAAVHKSNVLHRDLKAENIMLCKDGTVKLFDFGLSRHDARRPTITERPKLLGTSTHVAPESWSGGHYSFLSDIYAFGVIGYEIATGTLPFDGEGHQELMRRHVMKTVEPPSAVNPEIPIWLSSLIMHCLAKHPDERPDSMEQVVEMLEAEKCGYLPPKPSPPSRAVRKRDTVNKPLYRKSAPESGEVERMEPVMAKVETGKTEGGAWVPADAPAIEARAIPKPPPRPAPSAGPHALFLGVLLVLLLGACIGWYSFKHSARSAETTAVVNASPTPQADVKPTPKKMAGAAKGAKKKSAKK